MKAELGKHTNSPSDSETGSVCDREGKTILQHFQQSWTKADCFMCKISKLF